MAGPTVVCSASDQCHVAGVCDPATGRCSNPVAPDGTGCGSNGTCQGGRCVGVCIAVRSVCNPETDVCCNEEGEFCSDNAVCAQPGEAGRCCRPEGAFCTRRCHCCDGGCINDVCCTLGKQCNDSSECCEGEECVGDICTRVCGSDGDLCSDNPGQVSC